MSRKKRDNRKKVKQKRAKKLTPLGIFLRTFFGVLGAGLCGILIYSYVFRPGSRPEGAGELGGMQGESREGLASFWEIIPQKEDVREAMQHIPQEAETDPGIYADVLADPEYMAANNIYAVENQTDGIVTVGFAGDILFDDEYAMMANLKKRGAVIENAVSQPLLTCMREVDIMMLNNEFPYTDRGTATEGKTFTFRADTSTVNYLSDMGVDVVSPANNPSYGFGEVGLLDSLDTLREAGMPYVGAGRNLEEASRPVYFIAGDIKIAIISATQIERLENPDTKGAAAGSGAQACGSGSGSDYRSPSALPSGNSILRGGAGCL